MGKVRWVRGLDLGENENDSGYVKECFMSSNIKSICYPDICGHVSETYKGCREIVKNIEAFCVCAVYLGRETHNVVNNVSKGGAALCFRESGEVTENARSARKMSG